MSMIRFDRSKALTVPRFAVLLAAVVAAGTVLVSAASAAVAPANTALPSVGGTLVVGSTLTAAPGTWSGDAPIEFTYQWQRCDSPATTCADISGAGSATYVLAPLDSGGTVRVAVTGSNAAGSQIAYSATTATIANAVGAPLGTAVPAISGTLVAGSTLTATTGTWAGTLPMTFTFQWLRCDAAGATCQTIAGAAGLSYVLALDDIGHTLRFKVGATNAAGAATATSLQTAVVVAPTSTDGQPTSKRQCKHHGWKTFTSPSFRNQGQCVRSIVAQSPDNRHHGHGDDDHGSSTSHGKNTLGLSKSSLQSNGKGHDKSHGRHGGNDGSDD